MTKVQIPKQVQIPMTDGLKATCLGQLGLGRSLGFGPWSLVIFLPVHRRTLIFPAVRPAELTAILRGTIFRCLAQRVYDEALAHPAFLPPS